MNSPNQTIPAPSRSMATAYCLQIINFSLSFVIKGVLYTQGELLLRMIERLLTRTASHYVAFIRKTPPTEDEESWIFFNDEKVAKAVDAEEMKRFAYIYIFRRV